MLNTRFCSSRFILIALSSAHAHKPHEQIVELFSPPVMATDNRVCSPIELASALVGPAACDIEEPVRDVEFLEMSPSDKAP